MRISKWLLAVALHLGFSSLGWALQLSEIRSAARLRLRDTTTDATYQRFTDSDLNAIINEGQRDFVNRTTLLTNTTTFGLVNDTAKYVMPVDFMVPVRVTVVNKMLTETSYNELDQDQLDWTIRNSTPTSYFMHNVSTGVKQIQMGFYPMPSTTTATSAVDVFYLQQVTALNSDTDVPFNDKRFAYIYHDVLVDYATAICWLIQGRADYAKAYLDLYGAAIETARKNLGLMPNYNPALRGDRGSRQ